MTDKNEIRNLLLLHELDLFTFTELMEIEEFKGLEVQHALEVLVKNGFLKRIEKGKYCLLNFNNEFAIGCKLVENGAIAYWSALHYHGLTEQFPNMVYVQTVNQKRDKKVFGLPYQFVKIKLEKQTGIEVSGYGNHQFRITDREKTLMDCFDLPKYAGGWEELLRAVAEVEYDQDKLIMYGKAISNIAALKRLAFIVELLELENMNRFLDFSLSMVRKKYNLFDPFGNDKGKFNSRWKLRLNISEDNILKIVGKIY